MHFNEGDSGVFSNCIAPRRAEKAAPLLKTLANLPDDRARELLGRRVAAAKGRVVGQYLLSRAELFDFAAKHPSVFNSLSAPDIPLFSPEMTVGEAKAIAPLLARDPHPDAALIRAIAASGSTEPAAIAQAIAKSEMWRFQNAKPVIRASVSGRWQAQGGSKKKLKLNESPDAETLRLKKQIEKQASSRDRLAAFNTLRKDLLGAAPRIRGALGLWDELFAKSSDADNATMLKTLTSNLQGDGDYLLERAVPNARLGGHTLFWRPDRGDNYMRNDKQSARYRAATAPVVANLQPILRSQAQSGALSELLFGIWLHAADPQDESARELDRGSLGSAAYANLDPAYRNAAADSEHFGGAALTPAQAAADPHHVSRELLELAGKRHARSSRGGAQDRGRSRRQGSRTRRGSRAHESRGLAGMVGADPRIGSLPLRRERTVGSLSCQPRLRTADRPPDERPARRRPVGGDRAICVRLVAGRGGHR